MIFVSVEFHSVNNLLNLAVDPYGQIAFAAHGIEKFAVMTLSATHERRKNIDSRIVIFRVNEVVNLVFSIFYHLLAADVRVSLAGTGKKKSEIIVNLGCCANR